MKRERLKIGTKGEQRKEGKAAKEWQATTCRTTANLTARRHGKSFAVLRVFDCLRFLVHLGTELVENSERRREGANLDRWRATDVRTDREAERDGAWGVDFKWHWGSAENREVTEGEDGKRLNDTMMDRANN